METALIIAVLLGGFIYATVSMRITAVKRRRESIRNKYGTVPKSQDVPDKMLCNYYETYSGKETVDDVTWNDLNLSDVFRRINNCDSSMGEEMLYAWMHDTARTEEEHALMEHRIAYVEGHEKERQELELMLAEMGKGKTSYYIPSYAQSIQEFDIPHIWVYRLLQGLLLAGVLAAVAGAVYKSFLGLFLLGAVFACNIMVYVLTVKARYVEPIHMLGNMMYLVTLSGKLWRRFEGCGICEELGEYLSRLKGMDKKAFLLGNQIDRGYGDGFEVFGDMLLGATMWHVLAYHKVMRRLEGMVEEYMQLYRIVGELDASVSVGSFRRTMKPVCIPEYSDAPELVLEEIYHPLVSDPVCNSVTLKRGCIITGSNASGKSTFIKAVAINTILGQSIHTCTASRAVLPRARMITSMAVRDDILSGESYFIKEIRYLKRILDELSPDTLVICVVDEILRGTNTGERIAASTAILEFLQEQRCIAIVASHDHELTELGRIGYDNYHFTEQVGASDITFDYVLRRGPADSRNAIRLLEFAGFPKEIVTRARTLAGE